MRRMMHVCYFWQGFWGFIFGNCDYGQYQQTVLKRCRLDGWRTENLVSAYFSAPITPDEFWTYADWLCSVEDFGLASILKIMYIAHSKDLIFFNYPTRILRSPVKSGHIPVRELYPEGVLSILGGLAGCISRIFVPGFWQKNTFWKERTGYVSQLLSTGVVF